MHRNAAFSLPLLLAGILCAIPSLHASGLVWQQTVADASPAIGATQVMADFVCRNPTGTPITVTAESGCECTTATIDHAVIAPGAVGTVHVIFKVGDFAGLHEEMINVRTNEPHAQADSLLLRVHIPQQFLITPRIVIWPLHAPAEEKIVTCVALPGQTLSLGQVTPGKDTFSTRVETIEPGRKYAIHVRPASTASPVNTPIRVAINIGRGTPVTANIYSYVGEP